MPSMRIVGLCRVEHFQCNSSQLHSFSRSKRERFTAPARSFFATNIRRSLRSCFALSSRCLRLFTWRRHIPHVTRSVEDDSCVAAPKRALRDVIGIARRGVKPLGSLVRRRTSPVACSAVQLSFANQTGQRIHQARESKHQSPRCCTSACAVGRDRSSQRHRIARHCATRPGRLAFARRR